MTSPMADVATNSVISAQTTRAENIASSAAREWSHLGRAATRNAPSRPTLKVGFASIAHPAVVHAMDPQTNSVSVVIPSSPMTMVPVRPSALPASKSRDTVSASNNATLAMAAGIAVRRVSAMSVYLTMKSN